MAIVEGFAYRIGRVASIFTKQDGYRVLMLTAIYLVVFGVSNFYHGNNKYRLLDLGTPLPSFCLIHSSSSGCEASKTTTSKQLYFLCGGTLYWQPGSLITCCSDCPMYCNFTSLLPKYISSVKYVIIGWSTDLEEGLELYDESPFVFGHFIAVELLQHIYGLA